MPKMVIVPNLASGDRLLSTNLTLVNMLEFMQKGTPKIGEADNSMYVAVHANITSFFNEVLRRNFETAPVAAPPVQGVCDVLRAQKTVLPGQNTHIDYGAMETMLANLAQEKSRRKASDETERLKSAHLQALQYIESCKRDHDEDEMREPVGANEEPCYYGADCQVNKRYGWLMKNFQVSADDKRNKVRCKSGACLVCKRHEHELIAFYFHMSGEKVDRSIVVGNWCNLVNIEGQYRYECVTYPDVEIPPVVHNNFHQYSEVTRNCVRYLVQNPTYYHF